MIDWSRVKTLRDEIGADCFDEVVELFLGEVDEGIDRLENGVAPQDLGDELHFLKGCALNLGFVDFAALCQRGEKDCNDGRAAQVDVAAIIASYTTARQTFVTWLSGHLH
jgi:HPt (histidine-containing phosphotransfer) domain-containing protein